MDNIFLKSKGYGGSYVNVDDNILKDGALYLYQCVEGNWVRTILTAEVLNELKLISDRSITEGGDNNA